ncbi:nitrate- and nitrite sensing domain-containing protein [Streptacidiphilus sp. EB129]|uniref:sensor histidine kinase n=1 Tax=Streptacidiphilus sp. EB129 TaxID=3156262 RepID=UPI0035158A6F
MVPVVSLMALWGFATVTTAQDVDALIRLKQVDASLLTPVAAAVDALQAERTAAARSAAAPGQERAAALAVVAARARGTDAALAALNGDILSGAATEAGLAAALPSRLDALMAAADALPALRGKVTARTLDWTGTMAAYGDDIATALAVDGALTGVQNTAIASDARVVLELARSGEQLAREDAAEQSAQAAGRMSTDQYQQFTGARYARQVIADGAVIDLRPADRTAYLAVAQGPLATSLAGMETAVAAAGPGSGPVREVADVQWTQTAQSLRQQLAAVETAATAGATSGADPYSLGVFTRNGAAVLLGLLAVLLSLLISVRIGRGLVVELVELRNSALELAGRRLPAAMRRLRAGEVIDVDAEAPIVMAGDDELGQVGEALNTVQRAALQAAVERAEVLSGVSGVFVNLARRSQILVHRQLTLLDTMERRTEDPAELEDLFRLDHLTTRMRRHAEGLIILSGAAPGRAWRKPVPLLDVVRSAVAEVEDYSRVEVRRLPRASVVGPAVADLTHLVAELVENATGFSPPHTKVLLSGEQVGTGYALEIEDRGLGMGREAIDAANRRIADTQQADLFDSDRLGLFVVSRLARRHNVRVSLRTSPYGGLTAVVLLPNALLESGRPGPRTWSRTGPEAERQPALVPDADLVRSPVGRPVAGSGREPDREPERDDGREPRPRTGRGPAAEPGAGSPSSQPAAEPGYWTEPGPQPPVPAASSAASGRNASGRDGNGSGRDGNGSGRGGDFRRDPADGGPPSVPGTPTAVAGSPATQIDGLPRRVRQASLAAQLREAPQPEPTAAPEATPAAGSDTSPRRSRRPTGSPEDARATLSALADGWGRGRRAETPATTRRHLTIQQQEKEAPDGHDDEPHR